jgi:hypothetical protein
MAINEIEDNGSVTYDTTYDTSYEQIQVEQALSDTLGLITSTMVNAGVQYKNLGARFIFDYYKTYAVEAEPYENQFLYYLGELKYDFKLLSEMLTVTPKYTFKWDTPWYTNGWYDNEDVMRNGASLSATYNPASWLSVNGGIEGELDRIGRVQEPFDTVTYPPADILVEDTTLYNGEQSVLFKNGIGFVQTLFRIEPWKMGITAGMRLEKHNVYGIAFAPRAALNQVIGDFHYKFLYNRAFRSPNIGSIEYNQDIKPEFTNVFELELGYKINKNMFVTGNVFDITIDGPIVYWDTDTSGGYINSTRLGSRGAEIEYTARYKRFSVTTSYSYYTAADKPSTEEDMQYVVEGHPNTYFAAPQHKYYLGTSFKPLSGIEWFVSPSLIYYGSAYGNTGFMEDMETAELSEIEPAFIINLFSSTELTFISRSLKGLRIGIGMYDLLDSSYPFVQAYSGSTGTIPTSGLEATVKIDYDFKYKK